MMNRQGNTVVRAVLALLLLAPAGLLASVIHYEYDALNRLTRVSYPDGSTIAYRYDPAGNRTGRIVTVPEPDFDGTASTTPTTRTTTTMGITTTSTPSRSTRPSGWTPTTAH